LDALQALLLHTHPPDISLHNDAGVSIADLAAAAVAPPPPADGNAGGEEDEEAVWRRRLREEASEGEDVEFEGAWGWGFESWETPEDYAYRIWREMEAKKRKKDSVGDEAAGSRAGRRRQRYSPGTEEAEKAGPEATPPARDAAWREALVSGLAGPKRASYESRWQFFCAGRGGPGQSQGPVHYADIPWPLDDWEGTAGAEQLRLVVLWGAEGREERRQRLRSELMRWHPGERQKASIVLPPFFFLSFALTIKNLLCDCIISRV
jgi:hypothetical protein